MRGIPPVHPHSHPYGSNQPVPIIDHVLGESYYVVKTVYFHLTQMQEFLEKLDVAEELKEALEEKIQNAQSTLESFEDLYTNLQNLSDETKQDLEKSKEIYNQIQLVKVQADSVQDALDEIKDLSTRIESEVMTFSGLGCVQSVWEADTVYGEGAEVELDTAYLVGRNHLRLFWNGLALTIGENYEEVGPVDQLSKTVKFLFQIQEGDVVNAWVAALGKQEVAEAVDKAQQALVKIQEIINSAAFLEGNQIYRNGDEGKENIAPKTSAENVSIVNAEGEESTVLAEITAINQNIQHIDSENIRFKGILTSANDLPTTGYRKGDQYSVAEAGTYAGQLCEVGDTVVCIRDYAANTASNADWNIMQANMKPATDEQIDDIIEGLI
jgi:tetratricopeptide (TPR) repeat protein